MDTEHFNIKEHVLEASYVREHPQTLANADDDALKLHIKQYIPKQAPRNSRRVTIIGAHANAFPKELYEPLWDELYTRFSASGLEIASVWIADVVWQGQSGVLNEDKLGRDSAWFDHSRDLLHMINTFRHEMPQPLIGIGHSMGGCQITNLALFHPRLFASLVLLDPVISEGENMNKNKPSDPKFGVAWQSSYRKDLWRSREAAAESFRRIPVYQRWDPRVLDRWIKYGLRDLPTALYPDHPAANDKPVTLTTTKAQEGRNGSRITDRFSYGDVDPSSSHNYPFYRSEIRSVYFNLPNLRAPTFYIMGGMSTIGTRETQYQKVPKTGTGVGGSGGVDEGKVGHVFLENVGHLVPMDAPAETAEVAVKWLEGILATWYKEVEEFQASWKKIDRKDMINLDKQWFDHIGPPPSRGGSQPKTKL